MAAITITDWSTDTLDTFAVTVSSHRIKTLVTSDPTSVSHWLTQIKQPQSAQTVARLPLIVGLDIEWRPNTSTSHDHPAATLQLCTGPHCLIYQLLHTPSSDHPDSLITFLSDPEISFVGVGIESDVEKLVLDHGIGVGKWIELGEMAKEKMGTRNGVGLRELAKEVVGLDVVKGKKSVRMGRWDAEWLSYDQIGYATVDAFLSFEIGRRLID